MKIRQAIVFMLAGGIIGATAVQGIHAQAPPPVYFVFDNELTNRDAYLKEYIPEAIATIKAHGGKIVAVGKPTGFAGDPPKDTAGILAWESMDALNAWFTSPEYRKIREVGEKYAKFRNFAIPGAAAN